MRNSSINILWCAHACVSYVFMTSWIQLFDFLLQRFKLQCQLFQPVNNKMQKNGEEKCFSEQARSWGLPHLTGWAPSWRFIATHSAFRASSWPVIGSSASPSIAASASAMMNGLFVSHRQQQYTVTVNHRRQPRGRHQSRQLLATNFAQDWSDRLSLRLRQQANNLRRRLRSLGQNRGAWRDRDTNDIFAHCSLISYFLDFKFSNFICLSELHPLIWIFFKNSFRKKKNIRKTTQNALAPSIFIVLSIALKLGTPLLHTQAQNTLLQNFQFRSRSWDMNKKPPKTQFYPTRSALMKHNFFRRSKLKNL